MGDCFCQCEKPEPQSGCNKAIDLLQILKLRGKVLQSWDRSHPFISGVAVDSCFRSNLMSLSAFHSA